MPRIRTRRGGLRWNQTVGRVSQPRVSAAPVAELVRPVTLMIRGPSTVCRIGRRKLRLRVASFRLGPTEPACAGSRVAVLAEATVTDGPPGPCRTAICPWPLIRGGEYQRRERRTTVR